MGQGLPQLDIQFKKAAEATVARAKAGIVAVLVRDPKENGLHELLVGADIPAELGEANRQYVLRTFVGSKLGAPSKIYLLVLPPAPAKSEADGTDMPAALARLTGKTFDYLAAMPDAGPAECAAIALWVKECRKGYATAKAVLPEYAGDDEGIICFAAAGLMVGATTYTSGQYCSRLAGILAGIPSDCSATGAPLPEVTFVPPLTQEAQSAAINAGKLILLHDGLTCKIARAVNSLVTIPAEGSEDWQKIKVVEAKDLIGYYLRTTIENEYRGHGNSYDNKCLLLIAIGNFLKLLETEGVLEKGQSRAEIDMEAQRAYLKAQHVPLDGMTEQQIKQANTGSRVFLLLRAVILDAMEDFIAKIAL